MQFTDRYGDTYELRFVRYANGTDHGIEAVAGGYFSEPYAEFFTRHEYHVPGRHELPKVGCLWASKNDVGLVNQLCDAGLMEYTRRTTEFYGVRHYEVRPSAKWADSLPTINY